MKRNLAEETGTYYSRSCKKFSIKIYFDLDFPRHEFVLAFYEE